MTAIDVMVIMRRTRGFPLSVVLFLCYIPPAPIQPLATYRQAGNGTGNIGWNFHIDVGQYSSATVKTYIKITINDLFLIRKKN